MTLKNAALLALIGTILMTALLVWDLVFTFLNALRGVVPAGHAIPVVYLCVWLLQRDGVLLRVPPGAAVVISARTFGCVATWSSILWGFGCRGGLGRLQRLPGVAAF